MTLLPIRTRLSASCLWAMFVAAVCGFSVSLASGQQEVSQAQARPISEGGALKPLSDIRFENLRTSAGDEVIPETRVLKAVASETEPAARVKPVLWKNANLRYRRPYFEEYCLERYGYSPEPFKQPLISGTRFYLTAAALPFLPVIYSPYDCFRHTEATRRYYPFCEE